MVTTVWLVIIALPIYIRIPGNTLNFAFLKRRDIDMPQILCLTSFDQLFICATNPSQWCAAVCGSELRRGCPGRALG